MRCQARCDVIPAIIRKGDYYCNSTGATTMGDPFASDIAHKQSKFIGTLIGLKSCPYGQTQVILQQDARARN